jgi:serine/threonine protein kinase
MTKKVIIPTGIKSHETTFIGSPYYSIIAMLYIQKKYKNIAYVILPDVKCKNKCSNVSHKDISLRWIQTRVNSNDGYISVPKDFWSYFDVDCFKKRFIIFPFGFSCSDDSGHSNFIIYDCKNKTIERFEPYGLPTKICLKPKDIDTKIMKLFQANLGKDFIKEYHKPLDFLPKESFQTIQEERDGFEKSDPDGFCSVWAVWYIDLRLANADLDKKELIKLVRKNIMQKNHSNLIRDYSMLLVNKSNDFLI